MAQPEKSKPVEPGKMVVFTAAAAPSLEETAMMDAPTFTEDGANDEPQPKRYAERSMEGSSLTVPFQQFLHLSLHLSSLVPCTLLILLGIAQ